MTNFRTLGMWVVGGTSTTHVVCRHQMRIFNTSFAYLFWLANNKDIKYPEFCMGYIDETLKGLAMIFASQENTLITFRSKEICIFFKTNNKIPINLLK